MNYATIEEAWGDLSGRKKKKNKTQDPICELYEQKMNSSYSQLDLVNNSNSSFEKSKYQRNSEEERELSNRNVNIDSRNQYYDISDNKPLSPESLFEKQFEIKNPSCNNEEEVEQENDTDIEDYIYKKQPRFRPRPPKPYYPKQSYYEEYLDDFGYSNNKPKLVYLDLLLYIISGIILIFLLEQFVQIGKNMAL
jgi:hypothetical protein